MRPELGQQDTPLGLTELCRTIQGGFTQTVLGQLLQTFRGTLSSAHSKLTVGSPAVCSPCRTHPPHPALQPQFCRMHLDLLRKQPLLSPIPLLNAHPSKHTSCCRYSSMSSFSPDKSKKMIYSQVLSFERIPADEILLYRGSPLIGTGCQGRWGSQQPWSHSGTVEMWH